MNDKPEHEASDPIKRAKEFLAMPHRSHDGSCREYDAARLADFIASENAQLLAETLRLRQALEQMPNEVPTNWLDSLLTGPDAAIKDFDKKYDCREIEALLRGIQDRLRNSARAALGQEVDT